MLSVKEYVKLSGCNLVHKCDVVPFANAVSKRNVILAVSLVGGEIPLALVRNVKPLKMQQLDYEMSLRNAKDWFAKHPPNFDSRWTDACRWDTD